MKAIETTWKGYRFRSRTEARWAVFLEAADIEFEYEPEGVILPSGPYLPDFILRGFGPDEPSERRPAWLEVKGQDATDEERAKCAELALATGDIVLLAVGAPDFATQVLLFDPGAKDHRPDGLPAAEWCSLLALMIGPLTFMNFGGPEREVICVGRGPRDPEKSAIPAGDDIMSAEDSAVFDQAYEMFSGVWCWVLGKADGRPPSELARIGLGRKLQAAYDKARSARFEFGQTDKRWP